MKIKYFVYLSIIFLNYVSYSQITLDWVRQFNGSANMFDVPARIVSDNTGHFYIAGYSGELSSESGDFLLMKYTASGDTLWKRNYNGPSSSFDGITDCVLDNLGNIYVTGESRSGANAGSEDYCTIKYDSSGNVLWVSRYNGISNGSDVPVKIALDNENNVYVCGYALLPYSSNQSTHDIVTIKYNNNGDSIWRAVYNNNGAHTFEYPSAMYIDENGNIYITGQGNYSSYYDILAIKYAPTGNQLWVKRYNGMVNKDDYGVDIKTDALGNVYVLGSTTRQLSENFDFILFKYNSNGDSIWARIYNGSGNGRDFGRSMLIDTSGIYITGECGESNSQNTDIVTIKYDFDGNTIWTAMFDGIAHMADTPAKIVKDPHGYYFVIGSSARAVLNWDFVVIRYDKNGNQLWFDTYNSQGNSDDNGEDITFGQSYDMYITGASYISGHAIDITTIRYINVTGFKKTVENEIPSRFSLSQNYPNPFNPVTKIKFSIPLSRGARGVTKLIIYDILGREVTTLVNEQLQPGTYEVEWDGSNYPSGVYFYKLITNEYNETRRMVLLK